MFISETTTLRNIKSKNKKGCKETDHLFIDDKNKIVYYAELKANLKLDTGKTLATANKCLLVKHKLEEQYTDFNINMFLVSLRHLSRATISNVIMRKYDDICHHILGINEYLTTLGVPQQIEFACELNYKKFLNKFVSMLKTHN